MTTYPYHITNVARHILITIGFTILLVLSVMLATLGQQADSKSLTYTPTETQSLKLKLAQANAKAAQKDVQLAQQAIQKAQQDFQSAVNALQSECDAIKREQKWPETVQCNLDTLVFYLNEPPKDAAKPPAKGSKP